MCCADVSSALQDRQVSSVPSVSATYLPPPDADPRHHVARKQADQTVHLAVLSDAVVSRVVADEVALVPEASEHHCAEHVHCKAAGQEDARDHTRQSQGQACDETVVVAHVCFEQSRVFQILNHLSVFHVDCWQFDGLEVTDIELRQHEASLQQKSVPSCVSRCGHQSQAISE